MYLYVHFLSKLMINKNLVITPILILFISLSFVSAFNFPSDSISFTTFTGNLTNLSELQDVNIPSPSNNEVLTWNTATGQWISQAISVVSKWIIDTSNGFLYNNSDTLFFNDTKLNITIDDKILENNNSVNNYILYVNSTNPGGGTSDTTWVANWTAYNSTDWTTTTQDIWDIAANGTLFFTSNWNATNDSYFLVENWNATNTSYRTLDNITFIGNGSFTLDICIVGGNCLSGITGDNSSWNESLADLLYYGINNPSGFYNITDFDISNYYTQTQVNDINTSVNNYILENNVSVNNYILENNISVNNYINSIETYDDTWINDTFYNTTQSDAINTSVNNYILENNNSVNNYITENNDSVNNYILYVNSTSLGDDTDWNKTYADTLYYGINNPSGFYNSTDFSIEDYLTIANWNATNDSYLTEETNWNANYSTFLTHATTTYVDNQNTSQTNYIVENNDSVNNYILENNISVNNYINSIETYDDTWINNTFYNTTQSDAINTSVNNYILDNNVSVNNYILENNDSVNNYILENNNSVNNNIDSKLITTFFNATNVNPVTGTPAGTISLLQTYDGISYNVSEVSSDLELIVNFTGITEFNQIVIRYKSSVAESHVMIMYLWDYTTSSWESYLTVGNTENEYVVLETSVFDQDKHVSGEVVQVRFYTNNPGGSTHKHQFDWVTISKGPATPSGDETDPFAIHRDGNVPLEANWGQGDFNLTNTVSWFLGKIQATNVNGLTTFVNTLISTNNDSVNNYIAQNNVSVNNYILYVNSTNQGTPYDDTWINNTFYNTTEVNAINTSQTNFNLEMNTSVTNTFGNFYTKSESDAINTSQTNFNLEMNTSVTNTIDSIGTYDDTWINDTFYNTTQIGEINISNNNYILENNNSVNNYILDNNNSVNNYILYVNSTNPVGGTTDSTWISNWTAYNSTDWTTTVQEIWDVAGNGTLFLTENWNATNDSYFLVENWNATNTSYRTLDNITFIGNGSFTIDVCIEEGNCLSSITGDDSNWNKSYADILYYGINNPSGFYNSTDFDIADYVPYTGASSNLDLGANNFSVNGSVFFVDSDSDYVGVGTTSPNSVFHIKANIPGTVGSDFAGQLIIQNPADDLTSNVVITGYESDGSGNPDQQLWYLGSSSSSNSNIIFLNRRNALLQFGTSGSARMTILGNGNVGIGTATPTHKLNVVGDGNFTGNFYGGTVYSGGSVVLTSYTETDPNWSANYSTFLTFSNWNKTYADTLYADISVTGDDTDWNKTYADTLYYGINNPSGFYNETNFNITDYYTQTEVNAINTSVNNYIAQNNVSVNNYITENNNSVTNAIASHTVAASRVTAGTFGTGSYTIDGNLTTEGILLEGDTANHRIYDNSSCVFITGDTSVLKIC